jgi:transporter family-2 protein
MALAIGLSGWEPGALASLKDVNPLLLTAGGLGACLVFALAWVIPQAGAGPVMLTLLTGQVIGGMIMSHFGWLGSPTEPITLTKIAGVIVMMSGAAIVSFMK